MRVEGHKANDVGFFRSSLQTMRVVEGKGEAAQGREGASPKALTLPLETERLKELGEVLKGLFKFFNLELHFKIHEPTGEIIACIVNRETGEVIREIPPEKFLDMIAKLQELAGILVDEVV